MSPTYILELSTKVRGPTRRNLMNMLSQRFVSPFIVKVLGQKTLHLYNHEDDETVVERVKTYLDYVKNQAPSTTVKIIKQ